MLRVLEKGLRIFTSVHKTGDSDVSGWTPSLWRSTALKLQISTEPWQRFSQSSFCAKIRPSVDILQLHWKCRCCVGLKPGKRGKTGPREEWILRSLQSWAELISLTVCFFPQKISRKWSRGKEKRKIWWAPSTFVEQCLVFTANNKCDLFSISHRNRRRLNGADTAIGQEIDLKAGLQNLSLVYHILKWL